MRSVTSRAITCALADVVLVGAGPLALGELLGADIEFALRHDPVLVLGFLAPLALFAGVWGFFDARGQIVGQHGALRAALSGGVATGGAYVISQVFGFAQSAYAVGSLYPVVGQATASELFDWGVSVVFVAVVTGLVGAICAAGVSRMNAALLRVLPS